MGVREGEKGEVGDMLWSTYNEDGDDSYNGSHHGEQSETEQENQTNLTEGIRAHPGQDLVLMLAQIIN